jgi:hypothetical protein
MLHEMNLKNAQKAFWQITCKSDVFTPVKNSVASLTSKNYRLLETRIQTPVAQPEVTLL